MRNASTFESDAEAVRALGKFEGTSSEPTAHRISKLAVAADDESAAQAIADAKRALDAREGSLSRGEYRSAKAHIENAERAYARSQDALASAEGTDNDTAASITVLGYSLDDLLTLTFQKRGKKGGKKQGKKNGENSRKLGKLASRLDGGRLAKAGTYLAKARDTSTRRGGT